MQNLNDFDRIYADEQIRRSKSPFRRLIKYFYIKNILNNVIGSAIDLGCGAGQLLVKLPLNSLGLELNPFLIKKLSSNGLRVLSYDINEDNGQLSGIVPNQFKTLIISHVLEHFVDAGVVMQKLFSSANHLGITRVIIVLPGKLGYSFDSTHRTFINTAYIKSNKLEFVFGYKLISASHFPVPSAFFENIFKYQELILIYDKS